MSMSALQEDNDIDDWNPDNTSEDYRKLIVLPLHNKCISRLEVCQLYDPDRDLYRRYVNSRFREWSWIDREDDLKQALGGCHVGVELVQLMACEADSHSLFSLVHSSLGPGGGQTAARGPLRTVPSAKM